MGRTTWAHSLRFAHSTANVMRGIMLCSTSSPWAVCSSTFRNYRPLLRAEGLSSSSNATGFDASGKPAISIARRRRGGSSLPTCRLAPPPTATALHASLVLRAPAQRAEPRLRRQCGVLTTFISASLRASREDKLLLDSARRVPYRGIRSPALDACARNTHRIIPAQRQIRLQQQLNLCRLSARP